VTPEAELRHAIVEIGRLLYSRKLVIATDGNVSARLDRRCILVTPSGFCKGFLSELDIVRVALPTDSPQRTERPRTARASSETPMHLAVYQACPDAGAVIHAHPPYATSFAVSGRRLDHNLLPETKLFDGPVGRVPFLEAGSSKLAQAVARVMKSRQLCLLGRHGAVTRGRTLLDAYYRLERLEFLAQVTALAR
jgi:L-fuculose-phosphate aldolase